MPPTREEPGRGAPGDRPRDDRPREDCLREDCLPDDRGAATAAPKLRLVSGRTDRAPSPTDPSSAETEKRGGNDPTPATPDPRRWAAWAIAVLETERQSVPETPLLRTPLPELPGINLILKDESQQPSGSLKHRLARALLVEAIASGEIGPGTTLVEASSGSTAVSLAWFAKRLGLKFLAVVPASTAPAKLAAIRAHGAETILARAGSDLEAMAEDIAVTTGGHHVDQFGRAAEVIDWRGTGNIAAALLAQLEAVGLGVPTWIVAGAGTGGTATTIGRHLRCRPALERTRLCVVDPEGSAYFRAFACGDAAGASLEPTQLSASARPTATIVEGLGRDRVGEAFNPKVIDHMVAVSDEGSVSGAHWLARRTGRRFGPSTGTSIIGALILAEAMARRGETGTIALFGCDAGRLYADTIYDAGWLSANAMTCGGWRALLERLGTRAFPSAW